MSALPRDQWRRWGWQGSGVRRGDDEHPLATPADVRNAGAVGVIGWLLIDWWSVQTWWRYQDLAEAWGVAEADVSRVRSPRHIDTGGDGDPPDWYRAGMVQWPRCEECDEPDSATCTYYGASGTARVCRDCDMELFVHGRTPVTADGMRDRIARLRAERDR